MKLHEFALLSKAGFFIYIGPPNFYLMKKKVFKISIVCGLALCLIFAFVGPGEETHKQRIEKQFSVVNGEHINLTKAIKAQLKDPASYKNIETTYTDMNNFIIVSQEYTATNSFGARVREKVEAKVDTIGNVISFARVQ